MAVTPKVLILAKIAENTQTTQYTAVNVRAIIDKFTATNYGGTTETISVNLVAVAGAPGNLNLITKTKALQPAESYTFPELVGHVLNAGDFISTIASAAANINIRASGREVS